jgi:hypothetical protein
MLIGKSVETGDLGSRVIMGFDDPNAPNQEHACVTGGKETNGTPKSA